MDGSLTRFELFTADVKNCGGGLSEHLGMPMWSGAGYGATEAVLHAPFKHGVHPIQEAGVSIVLTVVAVIEKPATFKEKAEAILRAGKYLALEIQPDSTLASTTTISERVRPAGHFSSKPSTFSPPPRTNRGQCTAGLAQTQHNTTHRSEGSKAHVLTCLHRNVGGFNFFVFVSPPPSLFYFVG